MSASLGTPRPLGLPCFAEIRSKKCERSTQKMRCFVAGHEGPPPAPTRSDQHHCAHVRPQGSAMCMVMLIRRGSGRSVWGPSGRGRGELPRGSSKKHNFHGQLETPVPIKGRSPMDSPEQPEEATRASHRMLRRMSEAQEVRGHVRSLEKSPANSKHLGGLPSETHHSCARPPERNAPGNSKHVRGLPSQAHHDCEI
jgi:hypothetical protein